jgi:hypothetical protein
VLETTSRDETKELQKGCKEKESSSHKLRNQVKSNSDVDENIVCTSMQKEVNLSSLHHQEEKEMTKIFHIKIQVKKTKIDTLFDSSSQDNIIVVDLVSTLGLEVHEIILSPIHWVG